MNGSNAQLIRQVRSHSLLIEKNVSFLKYVKFHLKF